MSNSEIAIRVDNIKKSFKVYMDKSHTLKERILFVDRNKYEEREVIKGISFEVKKGEAIGLVGYNGCGKSTTLKMLTRIMYPDSGSIEIEGRVSSLLELGAGFHPDLSGRENIYINASIFGLNKKEIEERIQEIIDFSELEEFIDNPVRTYSSGMYMRLAFSVAISVNADVLLIDEILGVGDVNFQTKCFNKLMEIKGKGTTIVLVSHSTSQIERICDRSIWIQDGLIAKEGNPIDVHREYISFMREQREEAALNKEKEEIAVVEEPQNVEGSEVGKDSETEEVKEDVVEESKEVISIKEVSVKDKTNKNRKVFNTGDLVGVHLKMVARKPVKDYFIELNVVRNDGVFIYGCSTSTDGVACEEWVGERDINITFEQLNLLTGRYHIDVHVADSFGGTIFFGGNAIELEVEAEENERGMFYLNHSWMKG